MSELSLICFEWAVYFGSLSVLAWRAERTTGTDAFHLVVAYAGGACSAAWLLGAASLSPVVGLGIAAVVAAGIESGARRLQLERGPIALLATLLVATIALVAFDWATSHTPVSVVRGRGTIRVAGYLGAALCSLWFLLSPPKRLLVLRLGIRHRWSAEYWARPLPQVTWQEAISFAACWLAIIGVPLATTGLLSATILRDTALGVLVARVCGPRPPALVVVLAVTLAALRTLAGFAFLSSVGPPAVEAAVFAMLLVWAKRRTARSAWEQQLGR
jgi:hypothetical protein